MQRSCVGGTRGKGIGRCRRAVRKCGLKGPREQTYSRRYNTASSMRGSRKKRIDKGKKTIVKRHVKFDTGIHLAREKGEIYKEMVDVTIRHRRFYNASVSADLFRVSHSPKHDDEGISIQRTIRKAEHNAKTK